MTAVSYNQLPDAALEGGRCMDAGPRAGRGVVRQRTRRRGGARWLPSSTTFAGDSTSVAMQALRQRLLREHLTKVRSPFVAASLLWAAEEAAALAWSTPYPLLVFPALLEEKLAGARAYCRAQARIHRRSSRILHTAFVSGHGRIQSAVPQSKSI